MCSRIRNLNKSILESNKPVSGFFKIGDSIVCLNGTTLHIIDIKLRIMPYGTGSYASVTFNYILSNGSTGTETYSLEEVVKLIRNEL